MKANPLVTFIVPMRNGEETILSCLESIFLQGDANTFEVIVVDNGSSDSSVKLISHLPITIISEERIGRSHARNAGVRIARGEWIAFVDCDVVLSPDWLSHMIQTIITSGFDGGQGPIVPAGVNSLFQKFREISISRQTENTFTHLHTDLFYYPMINTAAAFYRKKSVEEVGGFDVNFERFEDTDLAWRLWFAGNNFIVVPEAKARVYWTHGGFFSYFFRSWKMGLEFAKLYQAYRIRTLNLRLPSQQFLNELGILAPIEIIRTIVFELAFMKSNGISFQLMRQIKEKTVLKVCREKSILCLGPKVRMIVMPHSIVLKDLTTMKKMVFPLDQKTTRTNVEKCLWENSSILEENAFAVVLKA